MVTPRRLADLPKVQERRAPLTKLQDLTGKDLRLTDFSTHTGRYGQGYRLTLVDIESGEQHNVLTTGVVICGVLDSIDPTKDLPVDLRVVRKERYYDIE